MKQLAYFILISMLLFSYSAGNARSTLHKVSIESALEWGREEDVQMRNVQLYFGEQSHPAVESNRGTFTSNKKTNAVDIACPPVDLARAFRGK